MSISTANPSAATLARYRYVAAGGETSISGVDSNGVVLSYTAGFEQVYLNGVLLVRGQDYTATNGTSITGLAALAASDSFEVLTFSPFAAATNTVLASGGANGQVLIYDSSQTTATRWGDDYTVTAVMGVY